MDRLEFDIAPFAVREETEAHGGPVERRRNRTPQWVRPSTRRPPPASPDFASPPAPCVCPAHGTEFVRWVQSALNRVEGAGLPVDGEMSAAARSTLRRFQRRRRLPADGIVGPETEQALREARRRAQPQPEPARGPGEIYEFETLDLESASSMPTLRQGSRGSAVIDLQRRLAAAGFSTGAADGVFGPLTDTAVRSFQRAHGLGIDGIVGPQTWGALLGTSPSVPRGYVPWPQPAVGTEPPWLSIALAEMKKGIKEAAGDTADNPRILEYLAASNSGNVSHDEVPWCGAFVGFCLYKAGVIKKGSGSARAADWLTFGDPLSQPRTGCIAVFKPEVSGSSGHVGFWLKEEGGIIHVIGGNQSNSVSITKYHRATDLQPGGLRWPHGVR
jgi:uncharacterized protein (TIGR02594 family)